jgi:hypothetical protein
MRDEFPVINKISFYCYLFLKPFDKIIRYDILWKDGEKYLLKQTHLNRDYKNESQHITVKVFDSLVHAIGGVILELRNTEIECGVYKKLNLSYELDESYNNLLHDLEEAVTTKNIRSFSMFGHLCKFRPETTARNFLKSLGYFLLTTKRPHIYVLDDYIKGEQQSVLRH